MIRYFLAVMVAVGLAGGTTAQEPDSGNSRGKEQGLETVAIRAALESLEALQKSIAAKREELAACESAVQSATNESERATLQAECVSLRAQSTELDQKFKKFAVVVDTHLFNEGELAEFDLQDELEKLLQPIVAELKSATATSREIEAVRSELALLTEQYMVASNVISNLDRLLAARPSETIRISLESLHGLWSRRLTDAENQRRALQLQLESKLAARKSVLETTGDFFKDFSRNRGLNLVLGVGAFCVVFFGLRGLLLLVTRVEPLKRNRSFSSRLVYLVAQIGSSLAAIFASIFVFNATSDWFLLGLTVLFLLGVGWASIQTIPNHLERIKLMLNIGAVRENDRIVWDGVPWRVESLGFTACLVNPLLDGGQLQLPIKYLIDHHSRCPGDHEEWFPTQVGDWVELADDRFGRVTYQTPSVVHLVELGGSLAVYETPAFLGLTPNNYSAGFRIELVFGIDYAHQADCTTSIPEIMNIALQQGIIGRVLEREEVKHLSVHFSQAAASSLDYRVILDAVGSAASKAPRLRENLAEILVDACNEHGWGIPFQQVTIHRADD